MYPVNIGQNAHNFNNLHTSGAACTCCGASAAAGADRDKSRSQRPDQRSEGRVGARSRAAAAPGGARLRKKKSVRASVPCAETPDADDEPLPYSRFKKARAVQIPFLSVAAVGGTPTDGQAQNETAFTGVFDVI